MSSRIGGLKRKSRHKLKKEVKNKGKISTSKYMQKFEIGKKVYLHIEPAVQKGIYPTKFMGKIGIIEKEAGNCYNVLIKDGKKEKTLVIHPAHLKKV